MAEPAIIRFHPPEVKREICDDLIEEWILAAETNVLARRFEHGNEFIRVRFASLDDRLALLNRVVREPNKDAVFALLRLVLVSGEVTFKTALSPPEKKMLRRWQKRRQPSEIVVHCRCFPPPIGGDEWADFYGRYEKYVLFGPFNQKYLQAALDRRKNLPLEVTYATYGQEVIRFTVLKPIRADEQGALLQNRDPI